MGGVCQITAFLAYGNLFFPIKVDLTLIFNIEFMMVIELDFRTRNDVSSW